MNDEQRQRDFPVTRNRIFFDHAKVAALPQRVRDAIQNFAADAAAAGTANYAQWMAEVEKTRHSFARLINAAPGEVAFVKNTSEGISIIANGIDWKPGDNVVIPDIEFPANVYPWWNLRRWGVETRNARSIDGRVPFDAIAAQVDARTRVISVSSVECNRGFRNDLARIGEFCREKDIYFCVDAIQSLGALPMDVKKYHIDFLAADGHKWLLSVEGLGGLYVAAEVLPDIYPVMVGWDSVINASDYMNYDFTLRPDAKRFEEGSFNVLSIHAFGAALSILHAEGLERIEQRIFQLGDHIMDHLRRRGLKILNSSQPGERSGIIAFAMNADLKKMAAFMAINNVSLTVRDGLARLSPHFYNTTDEADRFFDLLDTFQRTA